ncbi:MOSC domain-containing protein [Petropleomorpha daqingensis]|uniref:MOSC domain-containing protein n=1 Tax=Petropleomorpha daqingensis TaxID=2026353 RepID=A0A853CD74_9ACTN|nr:MOSC domain-containing protein [Petropleomorpha daqingensis]NYJ04338.1 hypothetical protein [Petropleomorpha daqingensis]
MTALPPETPRVAALARYPVKSMRGEPCEALDLEPRGVVGDRSWAAYCPDGGIGSGKTTRRFRRVDGLLDHRAVLRGAVPEIEFADGRWLRADDPAAAARLSDALGRPLALRPESDVRHHDESPVHVVTTAGLRALAALLGEPLDPERFRANVVLEVPGTGFVEDAWIGRELLLGGDVVLRVDGGMPRCRMVDLAQADLPRDGRILKTLGTRPGVTFGLTASVLRGGTVHRGDPARLR